VEKTDIERALEERYGALAKKETNLSCGGAIRYADARDGEICVDLGCGRGNDAVELARKVGVEGFVYGIDLTGDMIREAAGRARREGIVQIAFLRAAIDDVPLRDGLAGLLVSNCVLNHAADKERAWREVFRLLSAGGRFVISDIVSVEPIQEKFSSDPAAVAECWAGAVTKDQYMKTLERTGFTDIVVYEESEPYRRKAATIASFTVGGKKPAA
jgi:ubiquinone/menaquinone biosynthesis C-methylase UbiE